MKKTILFLFVVFLLATPADAMLAKYWRLRLQSGADMETLTYDSGARVSVRCSPWNLSSGDLAYGTTVVDDFDFGAGETIAASGEVEGDVVDNTSNLYWGIKGYLVVTADANPTIGTVYLWLEESDDNSNWPSDAADFDCAMDMRFLCALTLSTDAEDETRAKNFEF